VINFIASTALKVTGYEPKAALSVSSLEAAKI